jgi:hypothetical protein
MKRSVPALGIALSSFLVLAATAQLLGQEAQGSEASGAATQAGAQTSPALRFAWRLPARIEVTQESLKKGRSATTRFLITLQREKGEKLPGGECLVLRHSKFEFLKMEGLDLDDPEVKKALAPALALSGAIPDLYLDEQGKLVGTEPLGPMMDRVFDFMEKQSPRGRRMSAQMRQVMKSPQVLDALVESATQFWRVWVSGWTGYELPQPGQKLEVQNRREMDKDTVITSKVLLRHHGSPKESPGQIELSTHERLSGKEAAAVLEQVLRPIAQQMAAKLGRPMPEQLNELFEDVSLDLETRVVLDPKTMQPLRASSDRIVLITSEGLAPITAAREKRVAHEVAAVGRRG